MRQITFKLDESDYLSLSSLLKKINADRASPINLSALLRILITESLQEERRDYRYIREFLRSNAVRSSGKDKARHAAYVAHDAEHTEQLTQNIEAIYKKFDTYCDKKRVTAAAFASWLSNTAPEFDRSIPIRWYLHGEVPDEPEQRETFLTLIQKYISADID